MDIAYSTGDGELEFCVAGGGEGDLIIALKTVPEMREEIVDYCPRLRIYGLEEGRRLSVTDQDPVSCQPQTSGSRLRQCVAGKVLLNACTQ